MKKVFLNYSVIAAIAVSAAFMSCNKDKPEPTGQTAVNLKADITSSTLKVANDQWQTNDKVGLYMKRTGQALTAPGVVYGGAANVQMSISGQSLVANPPVMYPISGNVDFVAYYPYSASVSNDYTIAVNVAGQNERLPVEILYSDNVTNQEPTEEAVTLNFQYSLAKLEVTVTGGQNSTLVEADFETMTASIDGMYTQANLQLANGIITDKDEKQIITLHKTGYTATSANFEALVLPATVADGEVTFLFNVGGITYPTVYITNYEGANLYKLYFALDFPTFPEPKTTLLNAIIIPRNPNSPQNISVDATLLMTMTTEASGVSIEMNGSGRFVIDWGDGTPREAYMLSDNVTTFDYNYSSTSAHSITIIGENITYLDCNSHYSDHKLTSLNVSKNTALKELYCGGNQLTSLDVSRNTALTRLECNVNQLISLNVSKNTALTHLDCGNNQLTILDVSKNIELLRFCCGGNQLTSLDVSKNTVMTYLTCENNQLTALDVNKNTALEGLHFYGNQLTELDVSKNIALISLWCFNNKFTSYALNNLFGTLNANAGTKEIIIGDNPGTDDCDRSIATKKGWEVDMKPSWW